MPIFEYVCEHCGHSFEAIVLGSRKASCPKCESKDLSTQLSVFAVQTKGASSASSMTGNGACGSCGDPRGPGACSLPDLD